MAGHLNGRPSVGLFYEPFLLTHHTPSEPLGYSGNTFYRLALLIRKLLKECRGI